MRNYYGWTGIIRLCFHYYGENSFLMVILETNRNITPSSFPSYHSLSSNADDHRSFEMIMNLSNVTSSNLVIFYFFIFFI
jgi:hypothetical protein